MISLLIIMGIAVVLFGWTLKPLFSESCGSDHPEEVGNQELSAFAERELETDRELDRIGAEDTTIVETQDP